MKYKFLLLTLSFFCLHTISAKHIIGGQMYYRFVTELPDNSLRWEIKLELYRDCDPSTGGAEFDVPANIAIYKGANLFKNYEVTDLVITEWIPDGSCSFDEYICIEKGIYTFTVDLPVLTSESYFITYQRCCRNNSILNIIDPEAQGMSVFTEIKPVTMSAKINAPYFSSPAFVLPFGQPVQFSSGGNHTGADSVIYRLCAPHIGGGPILTEPGYTTCAGALPTPACPPPYNIVAYTNGYNALHPFGNTVNITINPQNGIINTMSPLFLGRYLMGICIDQFNGGVITATSRIEYQVNIVNCVSGQQEALSDVSWKLFPNPANNKVVIQTAVSCNPVFEIYDLTGRLLKVYDFERSPGAQFELNTESLLSGLYQIVIKSNQQQGIQLLVIE